MRRPAEISSLMTRANLVLPHVGQHDTRGGRYLRGVRDALSAAAAGRFGEGFGVRETLEGWRDALNFMLEEERRDLADQIDGYERQFIDADPRPSTEPRAVPSPAHSIDGGDQG